MAEKAAAFDGRESKLDIKNRPLDGLFVSWTKLRRADDIAERLGMSSCTVQYFYRGTPLLLTVWKYFLQTARTLWLLVQRHPRIVVVTCPPIFAVFPVYLYTLIFRARYVIDFHSGCFLERQWQRFNGLQKFFAKRAVMNLVHNPDNARLVEQWHVPYMVFPSLPPDLSHEPAQRPIQEPIQPHGLRQARFNPVTLPAPGEPDPGMIMQLETLQAFLGPMDDDGVGSGETVLGSNNWAIGPSRSAEGHAILAGDPHLNLTLPSIWYEAHLVVPGDLDVYGVTVPGTPTITIGFNCDVAWSFTNTGSDVMDLYRETVDDADRPGSYRLDGEWRPLERRIETYRAKDASVLAVDTILHTHRGPVSRASGEYVSLRWTVLEDQGELMSLLGVNRAGSVEEWLSAMEAWVAPTQNGLVADRQGNIAIRSSGRYPIRPASARGDWVFDGSTSSNDWQGWYPVSSYPGAVNPAQGYLASNNQQPVDPSYDDRFLGANWPSPWRAMRINQLLRDDSVFTAADLA